MTKVIGSIISPFVRKVLVVLNLKQVSYELETLIPFIDSHKEKLYMIGKREIEKLQKLIKEQLGAKFTYQEFHNQVLKNGTVTLHMLKDQILKWIRKASSVLCPI